MEDWVVKDTEPSNFYYDLIELNLLHMAHFVSVVTGEPLDTVQSYFVEITEDQTLLLHLQTGIAECYSHADIKVAYGRRVGWYAVARALKPEVVVETGVDHGVGACVLASALLRNAAEGRPGHYYGLDILPSAGRLLTGPYAEVGEMMYGDSIESLRTFPKSVDLFINDSDHRREFEANEYAVAEPLLNEKTVILGDNCHVTDALSCFARSRGMQFLFFCEKPKDHWYPGAGIGAAFPR